MCNRSQKHLQALGLVIERLLANLVVLLDVDDDASEPTKEPVYAVQESALMGLPPWASPLVENHRGW